MQKIAGLYERERFIKRTAKFDRLKWLSEIALVVSVFLFMCLLIALLAHP